MKTPVWIPINPSIIVPVLCCLGLNNGTKQAFKSVRDCQALRSKSRKKQLLRYQFIVYRAKLYIGLVEKQVNAVS